jgi:hypothetical protein
MLPSVRALLRCLIDYAGLFPPAQLPLEAAIRNYVRYRAEPEAWMLDRFVIPAARLGELEAFPDVFSEGRWPIGFSILSRGGNTLAAIEESVRADLDVMAVFRSKHGKRVFFDSYEIKLPPGEASALTRPALRSVTKTVGLGQPGLQTFYEPPLGTDWHLVGPVLAENLKGTSAGVKLRCGGLEPAAVPAAEQVACALTACRDHGVMLKCTAGLHHPIRHIDSGLQTKMHGFLNVYGAGVLAHALQLSEGQLCEIIDDEDASHFVFDEAGFGWKQYRAPTENIVKARRWLWSFGSCSFDEPRDDLRAMGILP